MRIRTKFLGSAIGVIGLTIGLSVGRALLIQRVGQTYQAERQLVAETTATLLDLELALQDEIAIATTIVLTPQVDQSDRFERAQAAFVEKLDRLEPMIVTADPLAEVRLASVERRHQGLSREIERSLQQPARAAAVDPQILNNQLLSLQTHEREMLIYIHELLESSRQWQAEVFDDFQAFQRTARLLEIAGLSLIVMLLGVQFYWLFLPLLQTLNHFEQGATAIGQGDLQHRLEIDTGDELAQLAATFNHMADQLARSYSGLEPVVKERTVALTRANDSLAQEVCDRTAAETQLKETLTQLQRTQAQLIQTEKMSSLGQLVAGIAHEINNPISFIRGNLDPAEEYIQTLVALIQRYEQECPHRSEALTAQLEDADLPFIQYDLPRLIASMHNGVDRISQIVLSLRTFSRLDEAELKVIDIHHSLDSTLMLLASRLRASAQHTDIHINKHYGELPPIECYAGQLNQVFMNVLDNAIDALKTNDTQQRREITLTTRTQGQTVEITIADNGPGITAAAQAHIFDPFFTTKPVGSGTGLGLSTSYQIITNMHQGSFHCHSSPGQGAAFTIGLPLRLSEITAPPQQALIE
ncbi:MAG: ATP-binding protein [Cyanobacteria bacterium J06632_22]